MGLTFAEKLLGRHAGKVVQPGEIVEVTPDATLTHDNTAAISKTFYSLGVNKVAIPERLVVVLDHCIPAADDKHAANHKVIREFVETQGIESFYDIGRGGVCHQVMVEMGHVLPSMLILGSDSHTTTYGAMSAFAAGIGRSEMAALWATGKIWLRVPESFKVVVEGSLTEGITTKDLMLKLISDIGADGALYKAVEFSGPAVDGWSIASRLVIANMSVEMGAKIGYFGADAAVDDYLEEAATKEYEKTFPDGNAVYERILEYDASAVEPFVAKPHTVDNGAPVGEAAGTNVHQVLLGTCTNGRIEDLRAAAEVFERTGKNVHPKVRMHVFPASVRELRQALSEGLIEFFTDRGAVIMNPGCGPCLGAHEGILAPGEVCVSTANRNFKGRMGNKEAFVYLGSPATAAAAAITGEITDFRDL